MDRLRVLSNFSKIYFLKREDLMNEPLFVNNFNQLKEIAQKMKDFAWENRKETDAPQEYSKTEKESKEKIEKFSEEDMKYIMQFNRVIILGKQMISLHLSYEMFHDSFHLSMSRQNPGWAILGGEKTLPVSDEISKTIVEAFTKSAKEDNPPEQVHKIRNFFFAKT